MKPNHILIALAILVLSIASFTGGIVGYYAGKKSCPEIVKSDTVRIVIHDSIMVKEAVKSKPRKVVKAAPILNGRKVDSSAIAKIHCDTLREIVTQLIPLADTCFYSDTLRNDTSYSLVINDTVVGHRLGLGVEFKNLRPLVKETVTNTIERKKFGLMIGGNIGINNAGNRFDAIAEAGIKLRKPIIIKYSYSVMNKMHYAGLNYIFEFGKK
jgi:hypothetical protein